MTTQNLVGVAVLGARDAEVEAARSLEHLGYRVRR